jgi:hypothetical protein
MIGEIDMTLSKWSNTFAELAARVSLRAPPEDQRAKSALPALGFVARQQFRRLIKA